MAELCLEIDRRGRGHEFAQREIVELPAASQTVACVDRKCSNPCDTGRICTIGMRGWICILEIPRTRPCAKVGGYRKSEVFITGLKMHCVLVLKQIESESNEPMRCAMSLQINDTGPDFTAKTNVG